MPVSSRPQVLLVANPGRGRDIEPFLAHYLSVQRCTPGKLDTARLESVLFVVLDLDFADPGCFRFVRPFMLRVNAARLSSLFVLDELARAAVAQLGALGGSEYLVRPLSYARLKPVLDAHANEAVEKGWARLSEPVSTALRQSLTAFNRLMLACGEGRALDTQAIETSGRLIADATTSGSLHELVAGLEGHHDRTFHHVLRACGYAVGLADLIGIRGGDLETVALAALLHDLGKARIPRRVLEFPSPLSRKDLALVRQHPRLGHDILRSADARLDPAVLDVVLHHHEALDGSGYPDGLAGAQISNLTLLVSTADMFAALTEERTCRKTLSAAEAIGVMRSMPHRIDRGLLEALAALPVGAARLAA